MPRRYKAKTLSGAQRRVRELEGQIRESSRLLIKYSRERLLLAKLAAKTPQFYNPREVFEAETIRDRILDGR